MNPAHAATLFAFLAVAGTMAPAGPDVRPWKSAGIASSRFESHPSFDPRTGDPWFTPDGRTLYFISTRSVDGVKRNDPDIWRVDRDDAGTWGAPTRLPEAK